ncbi:MAG: 30S ribosomal protein S1 [Bdellovibrionota bacterium]
MAFENTDTSATQKKRSQASGAGVKDPTSWMDEFDAGTGSDDDKKNGQYTEDGHSFAELYEQSLTQSDVREGEVVDGVVVNIGPDYVTVDIGYKCEGLVPIEEFRRPDGTVDVKVSDALSVYLERIESDTGFMQLSKDKAEIIKAWDEISQACEKDQLVEGTVIAKVKGGLSVDIGVKAFLPGSQIDVKPVKNLDKYLGKKFKFKIIKFNKKRGNIVLSRRAIIAQEKERQRAETLSTLQEDQIITGTVKNITEYGAFIDLGGMDGLLHITDMSWGRVKHPSELFSVGDEIKVKVLKYDREKERISLGLKQVSPNPWEELASKINIGDRVKGKVVSIKDYGAFVELSEGIEGLIHVSEMSWRRDVKHPSKVLNVGDEVECQVLEIDAKNKRLSLGLKQLQANPWSALEEKYPSGKIIEGEVKSVTDFGIFVDIGEGIDGLVHVSDISWNKKLAHPSERFKKGDKLKAMVLSIDKETEKFSLGIKQLEKDPWETAKNKYRVGEAIEGKITKVTDFGAFVELEEGIEGLVYVSELSDQRVEKPSEVVKVGDVVRAEVISLDTKERRIGLSMKKLKHTEERRDYESYVGQRDKKTSLGDVLGAQLKGILNKGDEENNE